MAKRDKKSAVAEAKGAEAVTDEAEESSAELEESPETKGGEETLESLRAERDALEGLLQRAHADYQNQKRRALADQEAGIRRNLQPLLESLLLVLDHLDMALLSPAEAQETKNFAMGVQMTRDQLVRSLEENGVTKIDSDGAFDPELHQAVSTVTDTDAEPGTIVETVRLGFLWRDTVLRHAQVRVAAAPDEADEAED